MFQSEQRPSPLSGRISRNTAQEFAVREMEYGMQGQITKFHESIGFGIISAADGRKYRFSKSDIRNPNGRLVGLDVDFVVESHSPSPRDIILLHGSPWTVFGPATPAKKRS